MLGGGHVPTLPSFTFDGRRTALRIRAHHDNHTGSPTKTGEAHTHTHTHADTRLTLPVNAVELIGRRLLLLKIPHILVENEDGRAFVV